MLRSSRLGKYLPSDIRTIREGVKDVLADAFDATGNYAYVNYGSYSKEPAFTVALTVRNGGCVLLPGAEKRTPQAGAVMMQAVLTEAGISGRAYARGHIGRSREVALELDEPEAALRLAALLVERLPGPFAIRCRLRKELARLGIPWRFDIRHGDLRPGPLSVQETHVLYTAVHGADTTKTFDLTQDDGARKMLARLARDLAAIDVNIPAQLSHCCRPLVWPCEGPHDVEWGSLSTEAATRLTVALEAAREKRQPGVKPA
ncbi:hypothetical protein [Streptomyces sp. NPDC002221]|uniref:hypothetical protein n=1 Tax=Streptomyces sp. NPDC002221 TaxID=3364639 RepID=UPI0036D05CF7